MSESGSFFLSIWVGKLIPSKVRKLVLMSVNDCAVRTKTPVSKCRQLSAAMWTQLLVYGRGTSHDTWIRSCSFSGIWVGPKGYPKEERAQTSEYVLSSFLLPYNSLVFLERAARRVLAGCEGELLPLLLEHVEKSWALQCGIASLGPLRVICRSIPSCLPCHSLDLLHSSLPAVCGCSHDLPEARFLIGRPQVGPEATAMPSPSLQLAWCSCAVVMTQARQGLQVSLPPPGG